MPRFIPSRSSGPPGVSSQPLGSQASNSSVQCVCVCAYTHTYTHIHSHPRQKDKEDTDNTSISPSVKNNRDPPRFATSAFIHYLHPPTLVPQR